MRPRPIRRVGRPRFRWDYVALEEFWKYLQKWRRLWRWITLDHTQAEHCAWGASIRPRRCRQENLALQSPSRLQ
eukprot:12727142-Prorocentrum_lima.AAC.1